MAFGIDEDVSDRSTDYDIADNFLEDFTRFSRSNQVMNEEQANVVFLGTISGLFDNYQDYNSIIVTGGSSAGKSHMLNEVNFEAFELANDRHGWVYELTGGSDKAGVDDEEIDTSRIAYFHELQKVPDEMLEFIKTISEDGTYKYGRNVPDPDSHGGRSTAHIERDPLPVIFSFADENQAAAGKDQELRTRTIEVKVDESEAKNKAVHRMKWGEKNISVPGSRHDYVTDEPDLDYAVKAHIRDAPVDINVVLPTGDNRFEGDDWSAPDVAEPLFNFGRSQSTRASAQLASLTKASALTNYHERDTVCPKCMERVKRTGAESHGYECPECDDQPLYIIAEPQDLGNVIALRRTLLATTHGLTEKKFAVLDAIRGRGGRADASSTAVQATKQDIVEYVQENDDIATMTKPEINDILDELDEHLIINKKDNPEDRREKLYVYDGSETFKAPNIYDYYDQFEDVTDPIRDQPIEQTIEEQLEALEAKLDMRSTASRGASEAESGSLTDFSDDQGSPTDQLSETEQRVAERVREQLSGSVVPADVFDDNALKVQHMVGDSPVERDGDTVRPERPPKGEDRVDGFMRPEGVFDDCDNFNEVEQRVNDAIDTLVDAGIMTMEEQSNGDVLITVDA